MLNSIPEIESEVEAQAKQRHSEVILLLVDRFKNRTREEINAAKSRYVSLKLELHRMKRQLYRGGEYFIWDQEGGNVLNEEKFMARYTSVANKVREAKNNYHQMVDNK